MGRFKYLISLFCLLCTQVMAEEHKLLLDNGEYEIPAIFSIPNKATLYPAIILLHGTASNKNEVGDLFARLADALKANGIASIRIDFAGTGDSKVNYTKYTLESATRDASVAFEYLTEHKQIKPQNIAVLGFSQGGLIAQLLAVKHKELAALVTWSSAVGDGSAPFQTLFKKHYQDAKLSGSVQMTYAWRSPLMLSVKWFEQVKKQRSLSQIAEYTKPVLAIVGNADDVVLPASSLQLIEAVGSPDAQTVFIKGADHIFNVLNPAASQDEELLKITTQWLVQRMSISH